MGEFSDEPFNTLPDINPRFQQSISATPRRRKRRTATVGRGTAVTLHSEELTQPSELPQSKPVASILGRSESGLIPTLEHPLECQELPLSSIAASPSTLSDSTESDESEIPASSGIEEFSDHRATAI